MQEDYQIILNYLKTGEFMIDKWQEINCLISCKDCHFGFIKDNTCYLHSAKFREKFKEEYPELFL